MDEIKNPVTEYRQERNWNTRELSMVVGVSYATVIGLEKGLPRKIPEKVLARLKASGAPDDLGVRYEQWREVEGNKLRDAVPLELLVEDPLA